MMTTLNARVLVALAALTMLAPTKATAWVAVRVAPRVFGAAAVGVAAGAVAGAATASAYHYNAPSTSTTIVQAPPAAPPAPVSTSVGSVVTTLPSGCAPSGQRYQCGSVWYQPYFGANGVYYQVVAP
jgi:hypothetical protein